MDIHTASSRRIYAVIALAVISAACATVVSTRMASDDRPVAGEETVETFEPEIRVPYVSPPEPGVDFWALPDPGLRRPDFPYLPGESRDESLSIGTVSTGYLVEAATIQFPLPHIALLPVQAERDLNYTSDEMLRLVRAGASYVAESYPGSVLYLGNFSAEGGGDIPYSVSHNSGRDADLAFYMTDEEGQPVAPPDLLPLDDEGKYVTEDGQVWRFDVARNWKLVEALVLEGRGRIQYIFVSNPLRKQLLDHARDVGADPGVLMDAATLLHQPGGALPHDDHFHLRIYCSERDVRAGCRDFGRRVSGYDPHRSARREAIDAAREAFASEEADVRLAAVRRLELLDTAAGRRVFEDALEDEEPRVRAAAARSLAALGDGASDLARQLSEETNPQVRAELIRSLSVVGGRHALRTLTSLLEEPQHASLPADMDVDLRTMVADALVTMEDPEPIPQLIQLASEEDGEVRARAERALRMLTNHDPARTGDDLVLASHSAASEQPGMEEPPGAAEAGARRSENSWEAWWKEHRNLSRDRWITLGFQEAGFDVPRISVRYVWELCRAITERDYMSYNAQRALMRLSRKNPPSLTWPKEDASFYWRRWFERRCGRFGCPPIPPEQSTLTDED